MQRQRHLIYFEHIGRRRPKAARMAGCPDLGVFVEKRHSKFTTLELRQMWTYHLSEEQLALRQRTSLRFEYPLSIQMGFVRV